MYSQNISTLKDVINSDIPILHDIPKYILGLGKEDFNRISPRLVGCPNFPQCIRRLNISRPFALAVFQSTMHSLTQLYPVMKDAFILIDGTISGIHISSYSRWTLPILDDLDHFMVRFHEAGLFNYWRDKVLREKQCDWKWLDLGQDFWADDERPDAAEELRDVWVRTMSTNHVWEAVNILIFGHVCAASALLGELAYHTGLQLRVRRPLFRFFRRN